MTITIFILGITICSAFTALVTEAVKKMIGKKSNPNVIAAICSIIVAVITAIVYAVFTGITVDTTYIVAGILLVIFSWIGAMVGYDKLIQTIHQITGKGDN